MRVEKYRPGIKNVRCFYNVDLIEWLPHKILKINDKEYRINHFTTRMYWK